MIQITSKIIRPNKYSRPGMLLKSKRGIVLHYTADPGASALAIAAYFDNLAITKDRFASAHFEIDRTSIVQALPLNEMGYHCGSTTYTPEALAALGSYPNNSTVGLEMCIEKDGSIHPDTFNNTVDMAVYLIQHEGFPEVFFTHKGVVGWKDCPLPWTMNPSEFERFKTAVHAKLNSNLDQGVIDTVIANWLSPAWGIAHDGGNQQSMDYVHWLADMLRAAASQTLDTQVCTAVIDQWLSPAYSLSSIQKDKDYIHWLANELRKAANIPTT